jgi:hypothetical protein
MRRLIRVSRPMLAKFDGSIAVVLSGFAMAGIAFPVTYLTDPPPTDVKEIKACVERQFVQNGFQISSSAATHFEGYVAGGRPVGPGIAVIFNADHTGTLAVKDSRISLPDQTYQNGIGSLQLLSDEIAANCLRAARPTGSKLHLG